MRYEKEKLMSSSMKHIIWKGIYYNSMEYLRFYSDADHNLFSSRIIGTLEDQFWFLEYQIITYPNWEVLSFEISIELNGEKTSINATSNNKKWLINNQEKPEFEGFIFIDISLSPFTNSLPINNLHINQGNSQIIDVIYLDILKGEIYPVKQRYFRKDQDSYIYQNIPNDFEAEIKVDSDGFVLKYPDLFLRYEM